jgi:hypothetical protein
VEAAPQLTVTTDPTNRAATNGTDRRKILGRDMCCAPVAGSVLNDCRSR